MKMVFLLLKWWLVLFFLAGTSGSAWSQELPLIDGKKTVAMVNEEPITLDELNKAISAAHGERAGQMKAGRVDFSGIMNRLITTRLIALEARNMGLDELPEVKREVQAYSKQLMMEILLERYVERINIDELEVQNEYENIVREWKIKSVRIKKKEDARQIESRLKAGQDFDKVVQKAIEWGIAESDQKGEYVKNTDLALPVAQMVSLMRLGAVSPVLSVGKKGYIIFKLEGVKIPKNEDPQARIKARRQALNRKKVQSAKAYYNDLKTRYAKVDEVLFESLDFEHRDPGLEKLLNDSRVLAEIQAEQPITVGQFSRALKEKFYHGVTRAIDSKRINSKKNDVLEDMLQKRILLKEALNQGLDRTADYLARVKEYEYSVLFGTFINKAVTPNIKLDLQELQMYYKDNSEAYSSPEMIRIKSLVFWQRDDAVSAVKKLKRGTDFNWLGASAGGQIDKSTKGLLIFDGRPLTRTGLPEDVQNAISRAQQGDYILYESSAGQYYVLYIDQIVPAEPQPFEAVQKEIAQAVFQQKMKNEIEQWADQLKAYYPVKIYKSDLMK